MVSGKLMPELQRLNYGVVFEPEAQLHMSIDTWMHTFKVQLPEEVNLLDLTGCSKDKKTCNIVNGVLLRLIKSDMKRKF